MRLRLFIAGVLAAGAAALAGCGSKVSEANYFKVHHGMTEADVDELLGPPHTEEVAAAAATMPATAPATIPATTRPAAERNRKVKSWTRRRLTIRVVFDDGLVVGRSALGLPFEDRPAAAGPEPARQNVHITPT